MDNEREVPFRRAPVSEPAQRLADLSLHRSELRHIASLCSRLEALLDSDGESTDRLAAQAFWHSVLVHYARCFSSGRRQPLGDDHLAAVHMNNVRPFHRWLIDLRDKHVAHSVNAFEDCQVGFALDPDVDDDETELLGIGVLVATLPLPPAKTATKVRLLAEGLLEHLAQEYDTVQEELQDDLRGRETTELLSQPILRIGMPPPTEVRRVRKK